MEKIKNINLTKVKKFLQQEKRVIFAYLFGSFAQKKVRPFSDIDIALFLERELTPEQIVAAKKEIYSHLVDILGTEYLDLVILNQASLPLAARVLQSKKIIVDKNPFLRHQYESLTLRKYFDFAQKEKAIFKRRYSVG
jgi:predicted nucleotidyltransferase